MGFSDLFKASAPQTIKQEQMLSQEQKNAQGLLHDFARTGNLPGMAKFNGPVGNFEMTDAERQGQGLLQQLLGSGTPQALQDSQGVLRGIANEQFDSDSPLFQTLRKGTMRSANEASDILNRDAAITGGRFGTQIGREKGLLAERATDSLSSNLAQLILNSQNQRLGAAQALGQSGIAEEGINQNRIGLSSSVGSLERVLKNAEAQANLNKFYTDQNNRIGSLNTLFNRNIPYGMKEMTVPGNPGPLSGLLNSALSAGGAALGNMIVPGLGGMIGGQLGGMLGSEVTGTDASSSGGGGLDSILGGSLGGTMFGGGQKGGIVGSLGTSGNLASKLGY